MEFLAAEILPRSARYATPDAIWNPVIELQRLLLAHNRGVPVYRYTGVHSFAVLKA